MKLRSCIAAAVLGVTLLTTPACGFKAPPNLTPQATEAWYGTKVIQTLDLLRDAVIAANAQAPPAISTPLAKKVIVWHESALKIVHLAPQGWQQAISQSLDELVKDLPKKEATIIAPYAKLAQTILKEVA